MKSLWVKWAANAGCALVMGVAAGAAWADLPPGGVIRVDVGAKRITFEAPGGAITPQTLNVGSGGGSKCEVTSDGSIVALGATGSGNAKPGLVTSPDPLLGVKTGGSSGVDCGQTAGSEGLIQTLAEQFAHVKVTHSRITVTAKQNVAASLKQFADGSLTEEIRVRSGNSIVACEGSDPTNPANTDSCWTSFDDQDPADNGVGLRVINFGSCSDSCPDNQEDVATLEFDGVWDRLELAVVPGNGGAISIGPGASPAAEYTLSEVDGFVECGDLISAVNVPVGGGPISSTVCRRTENLVGEACASACGGIPYRLNFLEAQELQFLTSAEGRTECPVLQCILDFAPASFGPRETTAVPVSAAVPGSTTSGEIVEESLLSWATIEFNTTDGEFVINPCVGDFEFNPRAVFEPGADDFAVGEVVHTTTGPMASGIVIAYTNASGAQSIDYELTSGFPFAAGQTIDNADSSASATVASSEDSTWVIRLADDGSIGTDASVPGLDLDGGAAARNAYTLDQAPSDDPSLQADDTYGVQYGCAVGSERDYFGLDQEGHTVDVLIQGDVLLRGGRG